MTGSIKPRLFYEGIGGMLTLVMLYVAHFVDAGQWFSFTAAALSAVLLGMMCYAVRSWEAPEDRKKQE